MTEREQLVKLLKSNPYANTPYSIADHLIANGVTVQRWIPVSERLPERFKKVLCWYEYRNKYGETIQTHDIGFYFKDDAWGGEVSNGYDAKVLAWMPLPEPPKGEAQ